MIYRYDERDTVRLLICSDKLTSRRSDKRFPNALTEHNIPAYPSPTDELFAGAARPATTRLMHRSKTRPYSITSSARASNVGGTLR
jgi:hypothetical protein